MEHNAFYGEGTDTSGRIITVNVLKYVQSWTELQDPFSVEREDPCGDCCPNPLRFGACS